MRAYGIVHRAFWTDGRVMALSDRAKLLALYLLTGPHGSACGCFRVPNGYISADLAMVPDTVTDTVSELVAAGFIDRCETTGWTWVRNFIRYNPIANPNVGKAVWPDITAIPRNLPFYQRFIDSLEPYAERFPEPLPEPTAQGMANPFPSLPLPNPSPPDRSGNGSADDGTPPVAGSGASSGSQAAAKSAHPAVDPGKAAAGRIADRFEALRSELWPDEPGFPSPRLTIEADARVQLDGGGSEALILDVVERGMRAMAAGGKSAPLSIRAFRRSLQDAIANHRGARASPVAAPQRSPAEVIAAAKPESLAVLVRGYRSDGRWNEDAWGAPPGRPGCLVPPDVLVACGYPETVH